MHGNIVIIPVSTTFPSSSSPWSRLAGKSDGEKVLFEEKPGRDWLFETDVQVQTLIKWWRWFWLRWRYRRWMCDDNYKMMGEWIIIKIATTYTRIRLNIAKLRSFWSLQACKGDEDFSSGHSVEEYRGRGVQCSLSSNTIFPNKGPR